MAAIIAQLTRAKRERAKKKTYETNKCMYHLPPFDPHFDPMIHNKYLVRYVSRNLSLAFYHGIEPGH